MSGRLSRLILFAVLYAASAFGALAYSVSLGGVAVLWPAAGVFLWALLSSPRSQWWLVCGALGLVDFLGGLSTQDVTLLTAAIFSASLVAMALVSAVFIQYFARGPYKFGRPRDVYLLLVWGCLIPGAVFSVPPALASATLVGGDWSAA